MTANWNKTLANLRDVLTGLYPDTEDQRRIAVDSGLPIAHLKLNSTPINNWHEILQKASTRNRVRDLIRVARKDDPDNEQLKLAEAGALLPVESPDFNKATWLGPDEPDALEKIIGVRSTLLPINFLAIGLARSRAVARVELATGESGSGFLIAEDLLLTNNHVLPDESTARGAKVQFNYQKTDRGLDDKPVEYQPDPSAGYATSPEIGGDDWTVVRLPDRPGTRWGTIALVPVETKVGDHVNIIQHPGGGDKQIALYHNTVVAAANGLVQYLTDTLPGSSGSPVFNDSWNVVALHHSGGWLPDPAARRQILPFKRKYYRNEGIDIRRVIDGLEKAGYLITPGKTPGSQ
jgi:hypothetical protein